MRKIGKVFLCSLLGACIWVSGCGAQASDKAEEGEVIGAMPQTLSIMGDSISTYAEWIPEGYAVFYPMNGEVTDVNQTWWKMVLDDMDMALCANASSSGSTCAGNSLGMDNPQHGCSDFRIADLMGEGGTYPDMIIVYMGTNDFLMGIPVGSNDGTQYVEEGEVDNFSDAYSLMLDKLAANYPGAEVFCCNLTPIGDWGKERAFDIMVNGDGLTSEDYSAQIEVIAAAKGCHVIDLQNCGITVDNMQEYVSDGVHLKPEGMMLIRDAVEKAITGFYQ
ncbi:MAG: GDSL-type esterase/lipase family protein [Bacillus sp. (in: Bacteria)]|nr:GDSL-type esterase/lipase family protein [Bacillus sp. (in: firmicutes)]MCM1426164.1 GDSL-type esterase/lipase family protein [Eubacterium sp.]